MRDPSAIITDLHHAIRRGRVCHVVQGEIVQKPIDLNTPIAIYDCTDVLADLDDQIWPLAMEKAFARTAEGTLVGADPCVLMWSSVDEVVLVIPATNINIVNEVPNSRVVCGFLIFEMDFDPEGKRITFTGGEEWFCGPIIALTRAGWAIEREGRVWRGVDPDDSAEEIGGLVAHNRDQQGALGLVGRSTAHARDRAR